MEGRKGTWRGRGQRRTIIPSKEGRKKLKERKKGT